MIGGSGCFLEEVRLIQVLIKVRYIILGEERAFYASDLPVHKSKSLRRQKSLIPKCNLVFIGCVTFDKSLHIYRSYFSDIRLLEKLNAVMYVNKLSHDLESRN